MDQPCTKDKCPGDLLYNTCLRTLRPEWACDECFIRQFEPGLEGIARGGFTAERQLKSVNVARLVLLIIGLAIMFVAVLLAVIASIFTMPSLSSWAGTAGFAAMGFCWFNIGLTFAITTGFSDVCYWHDDPLIKSGPLEITSTLRNMRLAHDSFQVGDLLKGLSPEFVDPMIQITLLMLGDTDKQTYYVDNLNVPAAQQNITLIEEENYRLQQLRANLEGIGSAFWVLDLFASWEDRACKDVDATVYIFASLFTAFILLIPFTIAAFMGETRFNTEGADLL